MVAERVGCAWNGEQVREARLRKITKTLLFRFPVYTPSSSLLLLKLANLPAGG